MIGSVHAPITFEEIIIVMIILDITKASFNNCLLYTLLLSCV